MKVSEILSKAADLIEPEGAWTQGAFARTTEGSPIGFAEAPASCFCVSGAIQRCGGTWDAWDVFDQYVRKVYHVDHMATFNDDPRRTQAEVVSALRQAAQAEAEAGR